MNVLPWTTIAFKIINSEECFIEILSPEVDLQKNGRAIFELLLEQVGTSQRLCCQQ